MKQNPHQLLNQCYCLQYQQTTVQPIFRHQHLDNYIGIQCIFCLHSKYMEQYSKFVHSTTPGKSESNFGAQFYCCAKTQVGGLLKMRQFLINNCCVDGMNCPELINRLTQNEPIQKSKYIKQLDYHITVGFQCYKKLYQKTTTNQPVNILQKSILHGLDKLSKKNCFGCQKYINILNGSKSEVYEGMCQQCYEKFSPKEETEEEGMKISNQQKFLAPLITEPKESDSVNQVYQQSEQTLSSQLGNQSMALLFKKSPLNSLFTKSQKVDQCSKPSNLKEKTLDKANSVKLKNDRTNNQPQEDQSEKLDSVISQGESIRNNQTSKKEVKGKSLSENKTISELAQEQKGSKKSGQEKTSGQQDLELQSWTSKESFHSVENNTEQGSSQVSLITQNNEISKQNYTVSSQTRQLIPNGEKSQHLASTQFTVLQNFDPLPSLQHLQRLSYPTQTLVPDINPKAEDPSTYFSIEQQANDQYFHQTGSNSIKIQQLKPTIICHNCNQQQVILFLERFCTKCFYQYLLGNVKIMK